MMRSVNLMINPTPLNPVSVEVAPGDRPLGDRSPDDRLQTLQTLLDLVISGESVDRAALVDLSQKDRRWCDAFGLSEANIEKFVDLQCDWIADWGRDLGQYWGQVCQRDPEADRAWLVVLWRLWLPLAGRLGQNWKQKREQSSENWIQGILGVQGTGKTTLGLLLSWILERQGLRVVTLSLDDLYKTHGDRQQLQAQEPRLRWRGPPGTHDVALGIAVLDQLRSRCLSGESGTAGDSGTIPTSAPIALPRFDKSLWNGSGDRIAPQIVTGADIVLFEGWCVGMRPLAAENLGQLRSQWADESAYQFALWCHDRLRDYLPLWERLDDLLVFAPQDYRWSLEWRDQAEEKLRRSGQGAMSRLEVEAFVAYFWTALHPDLFLAPLLTDPRTGLVVEVNRDRHVGAIYKPQPHRLPNP
ncbi:MAG: hypothetical protein VKK80_11090 [Prochlorothrix sp.]|nr:hypothetical protein [Prochlorothrix sp.]